MKKWISFFAALVMLLSCTACGTKESPVKPGIEKSQMEYICELAVMDCYYHNVAKYFEKDAAGILFWKQDKKFWIEYSGVVRLGIDASKMEFTVDQDHVTITLPPVEVLNCRVDSASLTKDSYIVAKDSAKITAEDETRAFSEAQAKLKEAASTDCTLLAEAEQRVKALLKDYVKNIGDATETEYTIQWLYMDQAGSQTDSASVVPQEEEVSQEP